MAAITKAPKECLEFVSTVKRKESSLGAVEDKI